MYEDLQGGLVTPNTGGSGSSGGDTKLTFTRGSIKYDTPFMDMTSTFIPRRIKALLRFISSFVISDGLVSQCITKMAEYPITKILYNDENGSSINDDKTIDRWKDLLEKNIDIMRVLKQAGMDYYAYGNSVISVSYPFKRMLTCPKCGKEYPIDGLNAIFISYEFHAKCATKGCSYKGIMKARDINTKEQNRLKIVHWDLLYIDIKYNSITGDHFYFYSIPPDMVIQIKRGDMDIINTTRLEIIEAVRKNRQLKIMPDNVFHLKRPAPQYLYPGERGWGIPVVMPVMKDIFHCKILKKGNEMIAFDHIVPLRILFPQGTGDVSPHATMSLSGWKTKIEDEIRKWKADQNYVAIVPLPLGLQNFSGDAKILSVTPEIKATEDSIITGIGIIPEIIRGGASWSGSNVSLRVVENTFLNHRSDMLSLLEFIVNKISRHFDIPRVDVKLSDFKMADDLEKKKLMMNAAQGAFSESFISRKTVTKELGFDPQEEYDNKMEELKRIIEMRARDAEGTAEANGAAAVINAMYNTDAEMEAQERAQMHQREAQRRHDEEMAAISQQNAMNVEQEVSDLAAKNGTEPQKVSIPNLILIMTQRFAKLLQFDPDEFKIRMLAMKNSNPGLYEEVYNNLREMNLIIADTTPDLALAQKHTPGELPSYTQGEQYAEKPANPIEAGANPAVVEEATVATPINTEGPKSLPESRPPRSATSSPI